MSLKAPTLTISKLSYYLLVIAIKVKTDLSCTVCAVVAATGCRIRKVVFAVLC